MGGIATAMGLFVTEILEGQANKAFQLHRARREGRFSCGFGTGMYYLPGLETQRARCWRGNLGLHVSTYTCIHSEQSSFQLFFATA